MLDGQRSSELHSFIAQKFILAKSGYRSLLLELHELICQINLYALICTKAVEGTTPPSLMSLIEFPNRDAVDTSRHCSWRAWEAAAEDVIHRHCPNIQDIRRLRAAATLPPTFLYTGANFQLASLTLLRCIV